jgi:signal transduction histidine kinase
MSELVDSLSSFAHLDGAERQWLDVRDSVQTVLTVLTHEFGERIQVETVFEDVPSISCHPGEIHQLLLGLLENAISAIEERGRIRVRVRSRDGNVEIEVEDSGRGIPSERLETLFDIGLETRDHRVQIDWGLAALLQIVREHGGEIQVQSEPGQGTRFLVTLPIAAHSEEHTEPMDSPPALD